MKVRLRQKTPIIKWIQDLKFIHEKQEKFGLRLSARVRQSINIKSHFKYWDCSNLSWRSRILPSKLLHRLDNLHISKGLLLAI